MNKNMIDVEVFDKKDLVFIEESYNIATETDQDQLLKNV
jgi:hypothetical protein